MHGMDAGAVEDLLATGGTWCRNDAWRDVVSIGDGLANGGEQHHLADGQRGLVMLFFVAERACHAAAAAWDDVNLGSSQ